MPEHPRKDPASEESYLWHPDGRAILEAFPKHAQAIGALIAEYAIVEQKLALLLSFLMGTRKGVVMPMVYAIESSKARLEAMRAAMRSIMIAKSPDQWDFWNGLFDEARRLLTQRNKYAHAVFSVTKQSGTLMKTDPATFDVSPVPLHDVQHQLERMKVHSQALVLALKPFLEHAREQHKASGQPAPQPPTEPDSESARTRRPPPKPPKPSDG